MTMTVWRAYREAWQDLLNNIPAGVVMAAAGVLPVWMMMGLNSALVRVTGNIVSFVLWMVSMVIALRIVDGSGRDLRGMFPPVMTMVRLFLAMLALFIPLMLAGGIATVVPFLSVPMLLIGAVLGIAIVVQLSIMGYLFIDADTDIMDGLRGSFSLARQNPLLLGGYVLLSVIVNVVGMIPFTLGLILTMPLSIVAGARVYRALRPSAAAAGVPTIITNA